MRSDGDPLIPLTSRQAASRGFLAIENRLVGRHDAHQDFQFFVKAQLGVRHIEPVDDGAVARWRCLAR